MPIPYRQILCPLLLSITLFMPAVVFAKPTEQQSLFLQVEKSLKRGNNDLYLQERSALKGYPLVTYLDYLNLTNRFSEVEQGDINQFVVRYPNLPQSKQLQYQWLTWLAKNKRWDDYLQAYQGMGIRGGRYQCLKGMALKELEQTGDAWKEAQSLWLIGKSQSKACDPLFRDWKKAGQLTQSLSFTRFWMAAKEGNTSLARYIDRQISQPKYKEATKLFWQIHSKPHLLTTAPLLFKGGADYDQVIMLHGIKRLASKDRDKAVDVWLSLKGKYRFSPEQIASIDQRLAMKFAKNFPDNAEQQIARIDPSYKYPKVTQWRVRLALADQNWNRVLKLIERLPKSEQSNNRWLYWRTVARLKNSGYPSPFYPSATGRQKNTLSQLSQDRNFYSFLVADLSRSPFQMNHEAASFRKSDLNRLEAKYKAFSRIKEWLYFERIYNAQSELNSIAPKFTSTERKLLPYIAQRLNWHHQAIMTAARESLWNDLDLRFPSPQYQLFNEHAKKQQVDSSWIIAIARQESAFNPMARSHAGARGLMQLMPATAKEAARKGRIPYRKVSDLYQPEVNIAIGTAHLAWLSGRFEENKIFATAAYNAGSTAVKRWLKDRGHLPLDIWIETIPYDETRNYVQNVLAFRVIYSERDNRSGNPPASQPVRMFSPREAATLTLAPARQSLVVRKHPGRGN